MECFADGNLQGTDLAIYRSDGKSVKKKNTITTNTGYRLRFFFMSAASFQQGIEKFYNRKRTPSNAFRPHLL